MAIRARFASKGFSTRAQAASPPIFLDVVSESGNTFEQKLHFARGIDTIKPRNISRPFCRRNSLVSVAHFMLNVVAANE